MKLNSLITAIILMIFLTGCENEVEAPLFKQQLNFDIDNGVFNTQSYIEGPDAHSGKMYSRAGAGNNYGFGYKYILPDSLTGKTLQVDVNAWVRTGDLSNTCDLIFAVYSKETNLLWNGCNIKQAIKEPNVWTNIVHTFNVPSDLTGKGNIMFNIMGHNIDAKSYLDIDDVSITVYEVNNQ